MTRLILLLLCIVTLIKAKGPPGFQWVKSLGEIMQAMVFCASAAIDATGNVYIWPEKPSANPFTAKSVSFR